MKKEQFNHLLFLLILGRTAEGTADDNSREHRTMCRLLQAATGKLSDIAVTEDVETKIATIRAANMSTSPKERQALFDPKSNSNAYDKLSGEAKKLEDYLGGKDPWEAWRKDKQEADNEKIGTQDNKDFPAIADVRQQFEAHNRLLEVAAEAVEVSKKWKAAKDFISNDETNNIKKTASRGSIRSRSSDRCTHTINKLWYGERLDKPLQRRRQQKIDRRRFSLYVHRQRGAAKECSAAFTGAEIAGQGQITTQWANLKASCALNTDNVITPHEITTALGAWHSSLTQQGAASDNKVRLGTSNDKSCTGASGKTCVDYTNFFKKTSPTALGKLPWYNKMRQAAVAIEKRALQQAQESLYAATIETTYAKAIAVYQAAVIGKLVPPLSQAQAQTEQKGAGNPQK
uniref:Variant surface glycoprotein 1445 n=1 Tax=Trypanosoma brucei TaxID=5691 RepID=M4SYH9_9TRYP|nr:variant surface glycoprotein 1445 [Trypanosoma brucei]